MDTNEATRLGHEDAQAIIRHANQLSLDLTAGERRIMVDGSMYSPSWRALTNGEQVWRASDDSDDDLVGAYAEALDRPFEDWQAPNGAYLTWDEGCLFVELGEDD